MLQYPRSPTLLVLAIATPSVADVVPTLRSTLSHPSRTTTLILEEKLTSEKTSANSRLLSNRSSPRVKHTNQGHALITTKTADQETSQMPVLRLALTLQLEPLLQSLHAENQMSTDKYKLQHTHNDNTYFQINFTSYTLSIYTYISFLPYLLTIFTLSNFLQSTHLQ